MTPIQGQHETTIYIITTNNYTILKVLFDTLFIHKSKYYCLHNNRHKDKFIKLFKDTWRIEQIKLYDITLIVGRFPYFYLNGFLNTFADIFVDGYGQVVKFYVTLNY